MLGAHVLRCPEDHPCPREVLVGLRGIDDLSNAKVEHFDVIPPPTIRHDQVFRLEVPMDDAELVRHRQGAGDLQADLDGPPPRQPRGGLYELMQPRPLHILHDHEHQPVLADAEVRQVDDVVVLDAAGDLGLPPKAVRRPGGRRQAPLEDLDGHIAAQHPMPSPVDLGHAAAAEGAQDLVTARQDPTDRQVTRGVTALPCAPRRGHHHRGPVVGTKACPHVEGPAARRTCQAGGDAAHASTPALQVDRPRHAKSRGDRSRR